VATTSRTSDRRITEWMEAGADVLVLDPSPDSLAPLPELLEALGKRDVQDLLLEGGATLAWSFVVGSLVDRVVIYLAPTLLGGEAAPGVLAGNGFAPVTEALRLDFASVERVGRDLRLEADVHRDN
jgi:diaminohydroxyphosphoribosylaminopyrimidine deaminase / 5-amino-6-(5-phosphoribosylamino)uracil reductase